MTTNAIALSRDFVDAGIDKKAADAIAEAMVTHSTDTFATKADLATFATKADIADLRLETAELKVELIKWMIGINLTTVAILIVVLKLL